MEFLKEIFTDKALTLDELTKALKGKGKDGADMTLVDLSQGAYVSKSKFDAETAKAEKLTEDLKTLNADMKALQDGNANAEEYKTQFEAYKTKFEELEAANAKRDEEAKAAAAVEALNKRFDAVTAEKKFINEHTKNGVMAEWRKAVESGEHTGKSDSDIYTQITKDTAGLYQGVEQIRLAGAGSNSSSSAGQDTQPPVVQKPWNKFTNM